MKPLRWSVSTRFFCCVLLVAIRTYIHAYMHTYTHSTAHTHLQSCCGLLCCMLGAFCFLPLLQDQRALCLKLLNHSLQARFSTFPTCMCEYCMYVCMYDVCMYIICVECMYIICVKPNGLLPQGPQQQPPGTLEHILYIYVRMLYVCMYV